MENKQSMAINLGSAEEVCQLIKDTPSGIYGSASEDEEHLVVHVEQGVGMDVHFYQKNGWIRVDSYGQEGTKDSETFSGRYNKSEIE